jgi:two-component system LytT family response regulator
MRVLVVDDEAAARARLVAMLEELDVEIVGTAENGVVAVARAAELKPDVVLLDIVMPEVDGFDVARHLADPRPLVIFQTAHDEHALRAFDHEAVDYVVKPVTLERLSRALDRARRRLEETRRHADTREAIERLASAMAGEAPVARRTRLLVRDRGAHRLLALEEVIRFQAKNGLVFAHAVGGARYVVDYTLDELEPRTSGTFARCSRADLVQLDRIARFAPNADGSAVLTLADGSTVRASRRRTPTLRRVLEG